MTYTAFTSDLLDRQTAERLAAWCDSEVDAEFDGRPETEESGLE